MIPVSQPIIAKNAKRYVLECLKTGWVSSQGRFVEEFEQAFAKYIGVKYAVAVSSGTAALHVALSALGIGKGDEVIIPAFTMIATALAVVYTGATPVLVDSEEITGNMDVAKIEAKITKKTKAIIPVHIYGHPADMDEVIVLAKKYKLYVVEDAAEAIGSEYKGKKAGSIGTVGCFSFYGNKLVTTGEGGMVVTNHKSIAQRVKRLKDMAHSSNKRFLHKEVGFNYRLTNLQAAVGLAQLESVEKFLAKKRNIAQQYSRQLKNTPLLLPTEKCGIKNSFWMYGVVLKNRKKITKEKMRKILLGKGIDTRDFFLPMHLQPALRNMGLFKGEKYPVAEFLSRNGFYLPSGVKISRENIRHVGQELVKIFI